MVLEREPFRDVHTVEDLYMQLKSSKPVDTCLFCGRRITFKGESVELSEVVRLFQTLVANGQISNYARVSNEVQFVRLCAASLCDLETKEATALNLAQFSRKKKIENLLNLFDKRITSTPNLKIETRLLAKIASQLYSDENIPEEVREFLIGNAQLILEHPLEHSEEVRSLLYSYAKVGKIADLCILFFQLFAVSGDSLGFLHSKEWAEISKALTPNIAIGLDIQNPSLWRGRNPVLDSPSTECVRILNNVHDVDQTILLLEASWARRFRMFAPEPFSCTTEERQQMRGYFTRKTQRPPDLSRIDELWKKKTGYDDYIRLYNYIVANCTGISDMDSIAFARFLIGEDAQVPGCLQNYPEQLDRLVVALANDGMGQYGPIVERLLGVVVASYKPEESIPAITEIISKYFESSHVIPKNKQDEIFAYLKSLVVNPTSKEAIEGLNASLFDTVRETTLVPEKRVEDLIHLANSLFAQGSPGAKKVAVQLLNAIPVNVPSYGDESIRRLYVKIKGYLNKSGCYFSPSMIASSEVARKVLLASDSYRACSPELFCSFCAWQLCQQGRFSIKFFGGETDPYPQDVQRLTECFVFHNVPKSPPSPPPPLPFQVDLAFMLSTREKEIPEKYLGYTQTD